MLIAGPLIYCFENFDVSQKYVLYSIYIIIYIILSDVLDGLIARWMDQVSNIGKIIDPVADKICMMVVLIYLIKAEGDLFFIFFLLITSRDTLLIIVGIYLLQYQEEVFQSLQSGKIFMFFCSAMMVSYIFPQVIPEGIRLFLYAMTILFFIISSYFYIDSYRAFFLRIKNARNF